MVNCRQDSVVLCYEKRMQQSKSTLGRPSGTDGSDYSYRMGINSLQRPRSASLCYLSLRNTSNTPAFSSVTVGLVLLIIADIGRTRSRSSLLTFYAFLSPIATTLLFIASLAICYSLPKAIWDFTFSETRRFDATGFTGLQAGLLLYLLTLLLFKICTTKAVLSLIFNMSPPKKAS